MTTINDIEDFVRVLEEHPDWLATVRALVLGDELMRLPEQLAQFIAATDRNFQLVNERLERLETDVAELKTNQIRTNRRLNRLEGRFSNFEGSEYERRVRYRFLSRATLEFDLDTPHVAFALQGQMTPALNRIFHRALRDRLISREEFQELHNIDIIIADENEHYVAGEASLTVDDSDITRARERADILALATGNRADAAVVTTAINESQRLLAESNGVAVFIIPYP